MGKGVDVSSLLNTEVNWDWRTSALSSAVSAPPPPAVVEEEEFYLVTHTEYTIVVIIQK